MALCPFASAHPIGGSLSDHSANYTGGPFRIVHHTTEGSDATGAFNTFLTNNDKPHFTVDEHTIYQHLDTQFPSRALRHTGSPQTNNLSAIQIEVVGFAAQPKPLATLLNIARLCRWIESQHAIPKVWPAGLPVRTPDTSPTDPHRNVTIWQTQGGHYGHCHVPENTHWDPGYSEPEVHILMQEVAVRVNGTLLPAAGGYLAADSHVHAWTRPVMAALGIAITNVGANSLTLTHAGQQVPMPATISDGYAFAALLPLTQFPGISLTFDGPTSTLTITSV